MPLNTRMPDHATATASDAAETAAAAAPPKSASAPAPQPTAVAGAPAPLGAAGDTLVLDFLIIVLGFGLCRAWIVFCLGAPLVLPAAMPTHWVYLACGAVCAAVVALLCRKGGTAVAPVRRTLFRVTPFALLASGLLIPLAIYLNNNLLMVCGFVTGGLGAGPLQVLWGDRFSHHSVQFAAFASPAAAVITAVAVALAGSQTSFMGFVAVPLLSFALLAFHAGRTGHSMGELFGRAVGRTQEPAPRDGAEAVPCADANEVAGQPAPESRRTARNVPLGLGKLMFSIMTFSLLCRMFDTLNTGTDPLAFLGGSPVFSLVVVGIAFFAIVAKVRDRFNATFIYRLSLPIMVAGYVAIALLFDSHAAISLLIINVGYEFFDILTWVLFVDAARRRNENALYIFGLGVAFMFCGMALGNVASHIVDALVISGEVHATVVAMAAILCLVVVAFLVLPEGTVAQLSESLREGRRENADAANAEHQRRDAEGETSDADQPGRIERHCAAVARDFGLTPRESEVIVLLAYGRTLAIIARDLHIAQGTARTHIENIYRKLDVHKQQELIDLVENHEGA
ncbi:LuxR C-terminal-related transcriptional regulator [Adlercreutzia sp. R21]|uniref:LuxR C-terminal-related transcriptional regulator n=1 Tax=Adlercreutzia wanghongyangiae TaxID=3111451 RepID=UPI002DB71E41|nr:LuxR C-terminal-related transcriptional regulator [Adlercreutzia sp. R21]MEC4183888.1 LuxR C-terminal-related transcriptional regulator [Adlercreutzia sp. R21]